MLTISEFELVEFLRQRHQARLPVATSGQESPHFPRCEMNGIERRHSNLLLVPERAIVLTCQRSNAHYARRTP